MIDEQFRIGKEVLHTIEEHGFQAYFVGGCVRDLLLDHQIKDIDIATSAFPDSIISIFNKVIPLGVEHGTVIVRYKKTSFEITTFRVEGIYSDQRHPDNVEFIDNIDLDLKRRDFTINALAMNKEGQIIDLFNGQEDLNRRLIRTVGDGVERFNEDPLRIIRAIRFASQLGFSIEKKTLQAIGKVKSEINKLAIERVTKEIEKLISGKDVHRGFLYLIETEVYHYLPVTKEHPHIVKKLPHNLKPMDTFGEFIAMLHFLDPEISIKNWVKQWKCSNKTKNTAVNLTEALFVYKREKRIDPWLVYKLQPEHYSSFFRLVDMLFEDEIEKNFIKLVDHLPIKSTSNLEITGKDIIHMFPEMKKGPWIQQLINELEKLVVYGTIENNHEKLKEWIKCNPPETN